MFVKLLSRNRFPSFGRFLADYRKMVELGFVVNCIYQLTWRPFQQKMCYIVPWKICCSLKEVRINEKVENVACWELA